MVMTNILDQVAELPFPFRQPYEGVIIDRNDPEGLGRVKCRIDGELERTAFILPVGGAFAGGSKGGYIGPPPLGATVLIFFVGMNVDNPRYLPGHHGRGEAPSQHVITTDGDNKVFSDERVLVEIDGRGTNAGVRISDKATGGNVVRVEIDLVTNQVDITTSLGVNIKAAGAVTVKGATLSLQGRAVMAVGKPI